MRTSDSNEIQAFLADTREGYGQGTASTCEDIIAGLAGTQEFSPFAVIQKALCRDRESAIMAASELGGREFNSD